MAPLIRVADALSDTGVVLIIGLGQFGNTTLAKKMATRVTLARGTLPSLSAWR